MRRLYIVLLLLPLWSCKKYARLPFESSPAYLRVFNDISLQPTIVNNGNIDNYLTFIMDPVMDKDGLPLTGTVVGDYLTTRRLYSISYPEDAANTVAATGDSNYEYPGRLHVLTAPALNGYDCSSWAQVPSGRHRLLFVTRPTIPAPFDSLTPAQRSHVIVDTTVDFTPGELYTVEAVLRDLTSATYGAYVRQEEFIHRQYATDSVYTALYNLSASIDTNNIDVYSPYVWWFRPNLTATGTAYIYDYTFKSFDSIPGYGNIHTTIGQPFSPTPAYMVFPLPPQSDFFDLQGYLGNYGEFSGDPANSNYYPTTNAAVLGTLPFDYISINSLYNNSSFRLYCWASPVSYNELRPQSVYGASTYAIMPNLNLIASLGSQISIYPTINILEITNDQVYLTQVQKGFNTVPQ